MFLRPWSGRCTNVRILRSWVRPGKISGVFNFLERFFKKQFRCFHCALFLTPKGHDVTLGLSTSGQCIAGQICRSRVTWHHGMWASYTPRDNVVSWSCCHVPIEVGSLRTRVREVRGQGFSWPNCRSGIYNTWRAHDTPALHTISDIAEWILYDCSQKRERKRFKMSCCAVRCCWDFQEEPEDIEVILQKARWPCCALSIVVVAFNASPKTYAGWFGRLQRRLPCEEVLLASKLEHCKTIRILSIGFIESITAWQIFMVPVL